MIRINTILKQKPGVLPATNIHRLRQQLRLRESI